MATRVKSSAPRSEMRTVTDGKRNYIVIRFWDDKNKNWEYQVFAEVVAKEAARDVAEHLGVSLPPSDKANVRTLWNILWNEKFKI